MHHSTLSFVGVDVGKSGLFTCIHGSQEQRELPNEESAILAWLSTLAPCAWIAVESTGRYHRLLVRLAYAAGHRVFVLNAQDVYFYARALGSRGTTDRKDARVIATYLAEHHPVLKPWEPATASQERLLQLLRCRAAVAHKRSALRQVLGDVRGLEASVRALENQFDELVRDIDRQVAALVDEDAQFSRRCGPLRTITGVGPVGSVMLALLFSRVRLANAEAVVAFSGPDPRPNDSGGRSGKRRLSKRGAPELRRQMYLAAFSAARSKTLRALYLSIKARGFKPTQALVILARKLQRVASAIRNSGKDFDVSQIGAAGACVKT